MYADGFGLLVFGALVTSGSLSKNKFFDRLSRKQMLPAIFMFVKLHPASGLNCVDNAVDRDNISCVTHVQVLFLCQAVNSLESLGHGVLQLLQNFFLAPEVVHVALHLLEVAAGNAAGCVW